MRHRVSRLGKVLHIVFLPAFIIGALFSAGQVAFGDTAPSSERIGPTLQINIPTITFEKIVKSTVTTGGASVQDVIDVPWITNYVAGVYRYAVTVASIIAGVMFLVGAITYLTAGGDSGRVSKAKGRIMDAVIGLALVLGAYVILLSVNPDLVNLRGVQIKLVAKKSFETISPTAFRTLTGQSVPQIGSGGGTGGTGGTTSGGSGMMGMAMDAARATGIPELPCFVRASMEHESGGRANALGHDENAASTQFSVVQRRTFINSGRLYSGNTFTPIGCTTMACQNQGPRNDDSFNASAPPDYGLDWRWSHGFGSGQSTVFPYSQPCPGQTAAGRAFRSGGHCYTIAQIMTPDTQVAAMVEHYKDCWNRNHGNVAGGYVCYAGTISPTNPIIVSRVNAYNRCRGSGG